MKSLSNITIAEFRYILQHMGLSKVRTRGGHEAWKKEGMLRPIIFQTHVDPIPEFIIRNNLRNIGLLKEELLKMLEEK
jgi:predicted RNA binding protein YcfA (HicA-like mRNA interferase family)